VGLLELSLVILLVLCQLPVVARGQLFMLLMVAGKMQLVVPMLMVVVVLLLLIVEMLHVGIWQLLVLIGGRLLPHLITDTKLLLVGRLVVWLLVLS
jgi:hypothetical protein